MPRQYLKPLMILGLISICPAVYGQSQGYTPQVLHPQAQAQSLAAQPVSGAIQQMNQTVYESDSSGYTTGESGEGMYPILNAPLYPCPRPNIPTGVGMTTITNPALAPHEMLYPHDYHAMYGPFYYKVHGGWIWTPLGMRQHENWKLQGTEVKVKYRSQIPLLTGYH